MRTPVRPLLALCLVGAVLGPLSPPAHAVETDKILVTNQYGGSGCGAVNQQLLVLDADNGQILEDWNTPNPLFGVFNEAKPFDLNRKVVALWGGSSAHSQLGGVGVYDRTSSSWTVNKALPTTIERGAESPHSIAVLPGGYFAVAHVGSITGAPAPNNGFVIILDDDGDPINLTGSTQLTTAHGVEWDGVNDVLYAVGATQVKKYTFASGVLTEVGSDTLPTSGGHDLRRRRVDNNFFLTTNSKAYIYRPGGTPRFEELKRDDGSALPVPYVKSVDQRFDGKTEYAQEQTRTMRFLDQGDVTAPSTCVNWYKGGRWIWEPGEKVYPEDDTGGSEQTWSPTFTVGVGANSWWIEIYASSDVVSLDVIGKNGQFFMSNLPKQPWGAFAQSPPQQMTAGSLIKLIGRKADGSSAGSITFPWLQDANPDTETGWNSSFTIHQCNSKVEASISAAAVAAKVRIGTADWAVMTKNVSTGRWERTPGVPPGTKYLIRAYLTPGTESAPQAYDLIRTC